MNFVINHDPGVGLIARLAAVKKTYYWKKFGNMQLSHTQLHIHIHIMFIIRELYWIYIVCLKFLKSSTQHPIHFHQRSRRATPNHALGLRSLTFKIKEEWQPVCHHTPTAAQRLIAIQILSAFTQDVKRIGIQLPDKHSSLRAGDGRRIHPWRNNKLQLD